jgi:hypothetical protein
MGLGHAREGARRHKPTCGEQSLERRILPLCPGTASATHRILQRAKRDIRMATETAAHIALLAPVPRCHLESALETETPEMRSAFGTKVWELFNELDLRRAGLAVDVYIYESHSEGSFDGRATWHARYVHLESERNKAKPYRPKSTETDAFEGEVYWIVEGLRRMQTNEYIPVADFTAFNHSKAYGKSFPPHRPLLVKHPL